jgi:hypothetical protein
MKPLKFLFLVLLISTIFSCRKKSIPTTVITTVNGFAIDNTKNKRLPNATITIFGCKQTFYGISCSNLIATTKTDSNGDFSITFNSDGKSIGFQAELTSDENYDYSSKIALTAGAINNIQITAREYNFLKTHLIISNNPFDTLVSLSGNVRHIFYGQYLDTNIMNRVMPNSTNYVIYSAWDYNLGLYRRLIDTLQIGSQDTTIYNRTLPNVNTFELN